MLTTEMMEAIQAAPKYPVQLGLELSSGNWGREGQKEKDIELILVALMIVAESFGLDGFDQVVSELYGIGPYKNPEGGHTGLKADNEDTKSFLHPLTYPQGLEGNNTQAPIEHFGDQLLALSRVILEGKHVPENLKAQLKHYFPQELFAAFLDMNVLHDIGKVVDAVHPLHPEVSALLLPEWLDYLHTNATYHNKTLPENSWLYSEEKASNVTYPNSKKVREYIVQLAAEHHIFHRIKRHFTQEFIDAEREFYQRPENDVAQFKNNIDTGWDNFHDRMELFIQEFVDAGGKVIDIAGACVEFPYLTDPAILTSLYLFTCADINGHLEYAGKYGPRNAQMVRELFANIEAGKKN